MHKKIASREYKLLNRDAVVSMSKAHGAFMEDTTFKVDECIAVITDQLIDDSGENKIVKSFWKFSGVPCEMLTPKQGWKKGRIRICLEFCPDEPEEESLEKTQSLEVQDSSSSLDQIRQMINESEA